jgi:hypothetical protein
LLAQLDEGIAEAVTNRTSITLEGEAGAKLFGIGATTGISREGVREEARSLQDLTYVAFERRAEEEGMILRAPTTVSSAEEWKAGRVHGLFKEGQLVNIASDVQVLDPSFLGARLERIREFMGALAAVTSGSETANLSPNQRKRHIDQAARAFFQGLDPAAIGGIGDVVSSLTGGSIAVRALPCGPEQPELGFGGVLLERRGYIQEEREALFGRYGTLLRGWNMVMQIASIPPKPQAVGEPSLDIEGIELTVGNAIKRATLEKMVTDLIRYLESIGLSEGPRWPAISVTPLAIFRTVPPAD